MTDEDVKKITTVFDERFKPLVDEVASVKSEVAKHTEKLNALWDQTVKITEQLEDIKDHYKSTLKTTNFKIEHVKENVGKLDRRLITVESGSGIIPPPELTIN